VQWTSSFPSFTRCSRQKTVLGKGGLKKKAAEERTTPIAIVIQLISRFSPNFGEGRKRDG